MKHDESREAREGQRRSIFEWPHDPKATLIWSAVGFGLVIAAGFVADGVAFGHWTLTNLPVFNRGSDIGFLTLLGLIAAEVIVGAAAIGLLVCRTAWRHRRAEHTTVEAQFHNSHQPPSTGHGRTGAGHMDSH